MAYFDDATLRRVQQAVDIVELIGERVSLKKSGKEFKGLCPFHADSNPSMYVNPVKQIFKCFACGAGGDVYKFIQLYDHVEFPEAVRTLAGRANIELEERRDQGGPRGPRKVDLAEANKWAARRFRSWLNEPEGEPGRKYFAGRGFTDETMRRFGLGFAPEGWDNLTKAAGSDGVDLDLLAAAGLLTESKRDTSRRYDTFRNRVIFPILDASERVIGFGGRTLGDDTPKYLNTAETPLFNKRRELYGLRWGRQAIAASGTVCVVEGYTDVIMAHQAGHENVVATLGTSLTDEHVKVLGRLAKRIVLVFDADTAGAKAADRALELFLAAGVDVAVATMPEGTDPCDLIAESGSEAFAAVIESSVDALEFKWQSVKQQFAGSEGTADRAAAAEAMLTTLAGANGYATLDPIRRGIMLDRLAEMLRTSADELNKMLGRQTRRRRRVTPPPGADEPTDAPPREADEAPPRAAGRRRAVEAAMAQVLGVVLAEPSYLDSVRQSVKAADFADPRLRAIAEVAFEMENEGALTLTAVLRRIESSDLGNLAIRLVDGVEQLGELARTLEAAMKTIEQERQIAQQREVAQRVRSGQYSNEDLLALAKRPRDLRRGGN